MNDFRKLDRCGRFEILHHLYSVPRARYGEIKSKIGVSSPTLSRALKELLQLSLIEKGNGYSGYNITLTGMKVHKVLQEGKSSFQ